MPEGLKIGKYFEVILQYLKQERRWLKALVHLECIIFLISLSAYFWQVNHLIEYFYDAEQLAEFTNEEFSGCFGGMIDENYAAGWYDVVPEISLRKGYYQYNVKFEGNAEGCAVWIDDYLDYHNKNIENSPITALVSGVETISEEVRVNADIIAVLKLNYSGAGSVAITHFSILETPMAAQMRLFTTIAVLLVVNLLVAVYCYQKKHAVSVHGKYIFVVLVLTSIFASYPLFVDYAIETAGHDFYFHITRIEGIKEGLLSGQFPVRINPTFFNGYGYANPIFYGETFLYLPAIIRLVGFPLEKCYNIYVLLVNIFTCFGSYYCFRKMFRSSEVALVSAVIYTMAPYRLMDVYLRSAVGEYTALAFLPFVAYGVYRIYTENTGERKYRWSFLPLAIGMTGIIQSHILTCEMIGVILLFICILLLKRTLQKKRFFALLKAVLVTVSVNLWFLVPFVDFSLTQDIDVFDLSKHNAWIQSSGLFMTQLLSLFQKYAKSVTFSSDYGITHEMPLTLGMPLILGMVLCVVMICVCDRYGQREKRQAIPLTVITTLLIWMTTIYFPWNKLATALPFLRTMISSLQYVWRFLGPATLMAVILTGYGLLMLRSKEGKNAVTVVGLLLCVLTVLSGIQFMQECVYESAPIRIKSVEDIDTTDAAMTAEYLPVNANADTLRTNSVPVTGNGEITAYKKEGTNISFNVVSAEENCFVRLPLLYYKGYTVSSEDGSITEENLSMGDAASVYIDIPEGFVGKITVRYREAWYWRLAEAVSVLSMAVMIVIYFRDKREKTVSRPQANEISVA